MSAKNVRAQFLKELPMRFSKLLTPLFVLAISMCAAESVMAQTSTYTVSFAIVEPGTTPQQAQSSAYQEAAFAYWSVQDNLEYNETIIAVNYVNEGFMTPLIYFIDLEITVEVDETDGAPPSRGGGGGTN
jgi:hypothetical protein